MNLKFNLDHKENFNYPYPHTIFENVLDFGFDNCLKALEEINFSKVKENANSNYQKIELKSVEGLFGKLLDFMSSTQLSDALAGIYQFDDLTPDPAFDGGGLTLTREGGFLRYHADFPFSNETKKYRVLNAILYLCDPNIKGGNLHLLHYESGTVERVVEPNFGRLIVFPTSKYTPHGFSKIIQRDRVSINSYFYSNKPIDDRIEPTKTHWFNFS